MSAPLMRITGPFVGLEQFVTENAPLAKFTWFKIGGPARWLVRPRNVEELQEASRRCIDNNIPIYVLGSSTDSAYLAAAMGLPYAFAFGRP